VGAGLDTAAMVNNIFFHLKNNDSYSSFLSLSLALRSGQEGGFEGEQELLLFNLASGVPKHPQ